MVHTTPRWRFRFDVIVACHLRRARGGEGWCVPWPAACAAVAGLLNLVLVLRVVVRQSCLARLAAVQADGLARLFSHPTLGPATIRPLRRPRIPCHVRQNAGLPDIESAMDFQELIRIRRQHQAYRPD